jgi:hypothetical protein
VTPAVTHILRRLVENFGFSGKGAPLTHSALASDFICLGKGPACKTQSWTAALKNNPETLNLLAHRIDNDWRKAPKVLRKSLTVELLARKQRVAATFIRGLNMLKDRIPEVTYQAELPTLQEKFMEGLLDDDLRGASESAED